MAITTLLTQAIQCHQSGQLDQAEALYTQALQINPNHAGVHHCLGLIASQTERHDQAIDHLNQALSVSPDVPQFHNTLGMVLEKAGRERDAIGAYKRAIDLNPQFAEAYNNLAIVWQSLGAFGKAIEASTRALALNPEQSGFHNTLGYSQQQNGQLEQALTSFAKAVHFQPGHPEPLNHMGVIYTELEQYDKAVSCLKQAITLATDYAEAYNHLGMAYNGQGNHGEAISAFHQALAIEPEFIQAKYNLGNSQLAQGHCDLAIETFHQCLAQDPNYAMAHWNLSHALLLSGQYEQGWQEYAWRHHPDLATELYPFDLKGQAWDGKPFPNQTLLVHFEQGYGDSIQCARFLKQVKALGGTVIMQVRQPLARIFETVEGIDRLSVVDNNTNHDPIETDLHTSLLDLPRLLNVTLESLDRSAYVTCPDDLQDTWQQRIVSQDFKVGIVWAGSPKHGNDLHRSCALSHWSPIMDLPGVTWYSLQKGPGVTQLNSQPFAHKITDLDPLIRDFGDTCGAIAQLDLVISVDTSVLHLAGAMGKPAWGLIPHAPDWRWLQKRSDSPWYQSVRLFRQKAPGNWQNVLHQVAEHLQTQIDPSRTVPATPQTAQAMPVIIPAYKNETQLKTCLSHLKAQTVPCDIFIRDNSEDNIFFTAAVNEGIKHFFNTECQYMLVLNQDMYLEPNAVEEMVAFMDTHPKCGLGAPLQLDHKNPEQVIWGGSLDAFPNGIHQIGPIERYDTPHQVTWINGACMILRKAMIQEIGLLDKNLVFLGSDSDYSFTARSRGWELWCIGTARGTHEHGASGASPNPFIQNMKLKDMIYFGNKWLTGGLYQSLAHEQLSPQTIESIMLQLHDALM